MFRIFIVGMVLGLGAAAATAHLMPVTNQFREPSMITVQPNGGNSEIFHINLPRDRILAGRPGIIPTPPELTWPDDDLFTESQTELFKIRDKNDVVVGVAGRIASMSEQSGPFIQWTLHLPARGTIFVNMNIQPTAAGDRIGEMTAGTREFLKLSGQVREQFSNQIEDGDFDIDSRIELITRLIGPLEEE